MSPKGCRARLGIALQNIHVIGISTTMEWPLFLTSHGLLGPQQLSIVLSEPHGVVIYEIVLKRPSNLLPPWRGMLFGFKLVFQFGNLCFQSGNALLQP
jgi:hypothetical protein